MQLGFQCIIKFYNEKLNKIEIFYKSYHIIMS